MLRTLPARFFSAKTVSVFNPQLAYFQAQRLLQYQVRQAQQAKQVLLRPAPTTRPKAPQATPELVACFQPGGPLAEAQPAESNRLAHAPAPVSQSC